MKIKLEKVQPDEGSSFRILKNPRLNELFYWHYHPEYELIFIAGADGTRHIGDHISRFKGSDLVFMGPNIPHLNFDFGIRTEYEKIVIQLQEDFLQAALADIPELSDIRTLFSKARRAIAFNGETKRAVGEKLKEMIQQNHFRQWIVLLEIFQLLATSTESEVLNISPIEHNYNLKEQERIKKIYRYVEEHYHEKVDIKEVVDLCNLSTAAFCRYFKRMTNMTFTEFLNQYRVNQAKKLLLKNCNVSEACFESGFTNLSYFNKTFNRYAQENPMHFKKRHVHELN
ncbi:MAG TPA: AraC family transcriptional regulator [Cyclobacteriaceae bacterium]|nr:AraC family transcriptional regulator [Cyclobacteriaceae bacterium]HPW60897.1 AraC family transcriptional regulator [Cyclobacteriaceae bacterium]HRG78612.1 AraC family transcriptional regulator [Cyclobacteriaceae bacterium]